MTAARALARALHAELVGAAARPGSRGLGLANLQRLLAAAGVDSLDELPDDQASALAWLAHWERGTVDSIIAALTPDTKGGKTA